jgi:glycosyltransferase involved in cell wall biosynthesis
VRNFRFLIGTSWGGSAVSLSFRALAFELVRRGHRVALLIDQERRQWESLSGNPTVHVWPSRRPVHFRDGRYFLRLARQYRPECVIANFAAVNFLISLGWLLGIRRRVACYHTLAAQIDLDTALPVWRLAWLRRRKRWIYRMATDLLAFSQAGARDLQQNYIVNPEKVVVFPYGLADPSLPDLDRKESGRVLCVGRLDKCKGQDVLIRALALLGPEYGAPIAEFVGDGPCRAELEDLARQLGVGQRCLFRGTLPHREALARMRAATVTVVPSRSEAVGCVALESMAVGTPVVASRAGGLAELVRDGLDGYLVPTEEPAALSDRLKALLLDGPTRAAMGRNSRQRFLEKFEQSRVTAAVADWLEERLRANG